MTFFNATHHIRITKNVHDKMANELMKSDLSKYESISHVYRIALQKLYDEEIGGKGNEDK